MLKLIYSNNGQVAILHAVPKSQLEREVGPLTNAQYLALIHRGIPASATDVREIAPEDVPVDRKYRDAWVQNLNKIDLNLSMVQEILLKKIRTLREPKLLASDMEFMKQLEAGATDQVLVGKRQQLRDATVPLKDIQNPASVQELEAAVPDLDSIYP